MILEAFQGAIVRNSDGLLYLVISWASLMALLATAAGINNYRRVSGHQPSSDGERPEPPRSGSGVQPPADPLARIARLRAELEDLVYAAKGGNADKGNSELLNFFCDHLITQHGERECFHYITAARQRARMLDDAIKNARDTLEATKP